MKSNSSLQNQISEMQSLLASSAHKDPLKTLIEIAPTVRLQRNYLFPTISDQEVDEAKGLIKRSESLKNDIDSLYSKLERKKSERHEQKSPLLFGKKKFQEDLEQLDKEIQALEDSISNIGRQLEELKDTISRSNSIVQQAEIERKELENRYNDDEIAFEDAKRQILHDIAVKVCHLPSELMKGPWENIVPVMKDFFRKNPSMSLFPTIGWEYGFPIALKLYHEMPIWSDSLESIIIDKEAKQLRHLLSEFLWSYVRHDTQHDKEVIFHIMKAEILFNRIANSNDLNTILSAKEISSPTAFKVFIRATFEHGEDEFGEIVPACFSSLKRAKQLATENKNEAALTAVLEVEQSIDEQIGFFRSVL